jgi:peptidylprolyl isomerase
MSKTKKSASTTKKTTKKASAKKAADTAAVTEGSIIQVHYKGTYVSGEEFDSSYSRNQPITVTVGAGQLLSGFDDALVGMTVGETKHISLNKEQAYGDRNPNAYAAVPKKNFPDQFVASLEKGATIPLTDPEGNNVLGTVETINEESVIFDMNHPMAGKDLEFDIEVVGFADADAEDLL